MDFLVLYAIDIFEWELCNIPVCGWHFIENDVDGMNDYLNSKFSIDEVEHVLNIKIYEDRSICLIAISRNTFLD